MGATAKTVTVKINADTKQMLQEISKLKKELQGIKGLDAGKLKKSLEGAKTEIESLKKEVNTLKEKLGSLKSNSEDAKSSIFKIGGAVVGIYAIKKALESTIPIMSSFIDTAAKFEQFETVLKTIEGSSKKASKSMKWITDFTKKTPYQLEDVTEAFVRLKAYGLEPTKGLLRTLGDTSSAMGKPLMQSVEAIADAVVGQNERLLEFGIRASMQGDKIAYAWSDASGRAKHIIIKNNKEIIQSTLEAIFNSKYAGAMNEQSKTWNGIISNIKDSWTNFKNEVMKAGLFDYFKALAVNVGEMLGIGFESAKSSAQEWSVSVIGGIESIIGGIAILADAMKIWGGLWDLLASAFWTFVAGIGVGINIIYGFWNNLGAYMKSLWMKVLKGILIVLKSFLDKVKAGLNKIFKGINWVSEKLNLGFKLDEIGEIPINTNFKTGPDLKNTKKDLVNVEEALGKSKEAFESYKKSMASVGDAQERLEGLTNKVKEATKNTKENSKAGKENAKIREDAIKKLKKMGIKDGDFKGFGGSGSKKAAEGAKKAGKALKKMGKEAKKAGKDTEKALKRAKQKAEKEFKKLKGVFSDGLKSIFQGDIFKGLESIFNGISDELMKPFIDKISEYFAKMLQRMKQQLGTVGGFMAGIGFNFLGKIVKGFADWIQREPTEQEIKEATGRSDFQGKSIEDSLSVISSVQYPMLKYTKSINSNLSDMRKSFDFVARSIVVSASQNGLDLTGLNYVPQQTSVLFGLFTKTTQLLGTGIEFTGDYLKDIVKNNTVSARGYKSEKIDKSFFFGLFSSHKIKTSYYNLPDSLKEQLANAFTQGYEDILTSAVALGFNKNTYKNALLNTYVKLGKLDFKGKTSEEISQMLEQATGEALDSLVSQLGFNGLIERYAKRGEGSLATLNRIAVEYEQASTMLDSMQTSIYKSTLVNLNDLSNITYTYQERILDIVEASGGLDKFNDNMSTFVDNFYTGQEKFTYKFRMLEKQLSELGVKLPTFNNYEDYKNWWKDLISNYEESAKTYGQLLGLTDSIDDLAQSADEAKQEIDDLADSLFSFVEEFYKLPQQWRYELDWLSRSFKDIGIDMPNFNNKTELYDWYKLQVLARENDIDKLNEILELQDKVSGVGQIYDNIIDELNESIDTYQEAIDSIIEKDVSSREELEKMIQKATLDNYQEVLDAIDKLKDKELELLNKQKDIVDGLRDTVDKLKNDILKDDNTYQILTYEIQLRKVKDLFNAGVTSDNIDDFSKEVDKLKEYSQNYINFAKSNISNRSDYLYSALRVTNNLKELADSIDKKDGFEKIEDAIETLNNEFLQYKQDLLSVLQAQMLTELQSNSDLFATYLGEDAPLTKYTRDVIKAIKENSKELKNIQLPIYKAKDTKNIKLPTSNIGTNNKWDWVKERPGGRVVFNPLSRETMMYADFRIPEFAEGGIVNQPTLAIVGEAGSEAIIPLDRLNTGGGGIIEELIEIKKELKEIKDINREYQPKIAENTEDREARYI